MKLTAEQIREILRRCPEHKNGECSSCPLYNFHQCRDVLAGAILKHVAQLEAELAELREAERWIPVEERLPEEVLPAIVVNKKGQVHEALYYGGEWLYFGEVADVTHWRPLPQPPEAKGE
ncbi:MAG: DUF551 domain-containing protein [Eubacteriales bacterium]